MTKVQNLLKFYFFLLAFINITKLSQSYLYFKYPYAFTIKDRNIFVIHEEGVSICDPTFKRIIRYEITFEEEEKINSDDSLSKVTSVYENGYIICLINDYIYIFDEGGNFKYKSPSSIHSGSIYGEYYTLVNIGLSNNCIYYIVGFVYNQKLYFYGYKYDISYNTNNNYANLNAYNHRYNSSSYYIRNKGLSCQYVTQTTLGQCLLCVYLIYDDSNIKIAFDYFTVTTTSITPVSSSSYNQYLTYSNHDVSCFKTALSPDKTKVFVVTYNSDGIGTYTTFDVNNSILSSILYILAHYYKKVYHSLKLNYFSETNEYLMTGILTSNSREADGNYNNDLLLIEFFDAQFNNYNFDWKYERSCNMNSYSILYLEHKSSYYILSDIECNGINYPLQILIGTEPTELMESTTEIIHTTEFNKKIESTEIIYTTEKLETIPETEKIKTTSNVENNEFTEKKIITEKPAKITNKIYELTEFVENPENTIYNENKTFSNCPV